MMKGRGGRELEGKGKEGNGNEVKKSGRCVRKMRQRKAGMGREVR